MVQVIIFSFLVSLIGVWLTRKLAVRWHLMDYPNERSFHEDPTPRIGGLGLIPGSAVIFLFLDADGLAGLWACALAVGLVSLLDDWIQLPRMLRFGVHGIAAVALLQLYPGWQASGFPLFGEIALAATVILVFIWITGLTNAYNFMDGIDGIAAWQGIAASAGWSLVFWINGYPVEATAFLGLGLACLGFLCWNRPTAKIFLGDVGSTFLGLLFAGAPLVAITRGIPGESAYAAGFLFVWPFVADTGQTLVWRALRREPIFEAHRSHIYQRLAATWPDRRSGHWASGLLYGGLALLGIGLHLTEGPFWGKLGVLAGIWVAVVAWTLLRESDGREGTGLPSNKANVDPLAAGSSTSTPSMVQPFEILLCAPLIPEKTAPVRDALREGAVAPYGSALNDLESALGKYYQDAGVVLVSSGTAALHLTLLAEELQAGDVVICPTFTFAATINVVRHCGAEPVFVDCRTADWGMDPDLLERAIREEKKAGHRVRGVIMVHPFGLPVCMERLSALCEANSLFLIEDTAGALGSEDAGGRPVGLAGTASACSFNANKMITTGMGGAVVSRDRNRIKQVRLLANQGKVDSLHYEHEAVGMNYRLSNFNAALGLSQWPYLKKRMAIKDGQFERYRRAFRGTAVRMMPQPGEGRHNHWMHAALLTNGNPSLPLVQGMRNRGIEVVPLWKPMHLQPVFHGHRAYLNGISESLFQCGFVLPGGFDLNESNQERVIATLRELMG